MGDLGVNIDADTRQTTIFLAADGDGISDEIGLELAGHLTMSAPGSSGNTSSTMIAISSLTTPVVWSFPYVWFGLGAGAIPAMLSFVLCLAIALTYHRETTTWTHCNVENWLPSFSAVIGQHFPEIAIWRIGVSILILQRLIDIGIYYNLHKATIPSSYSNPLNHHRLVLYQTLNVVRGFFAFAEVASLAMLTYVSSNEMFSVHQMGFIGFVLGALANCILQLVLFRMKPASRANLPGQITSYDLKVKTFCLQLAATVGATYTYIRHEQYCEPGMYSLFALCEYTLIMSNIFFHLTLWWDAPTTIMAIRLDLPSVWVNHHAPKESQSLVSVSGWSSFRSSQRRTSCTSVL